MIESKQNVNLIVLNFNIKFQISENIMLDTLRKLGNSYKVQHTIV